MTSLPDAFDQGAEALWKAKANGEKLFKPEVAQIFRTAFQAFHVSSPEAQQPHPKKPSRARNPIFDALCIFEGIDPSHVTKQAAGRMGEARKQILEVSPDVTPDEIKLRGEKYVRLFPGISRTVMGLCSHWHKCGSSDRTKAAKKDPYQEPPNWKETALRMFPGTDVPDLAWLNLPITIRADILSKLP